MVGTARPIGMASMTAPQHRTYSFICGCGHSGTSLIANMFASHPDVFIPLYETRAFLEQENANKAWKQLKEKFTASTKTHFVEKTPSHINVLTEIRQQIPGAKFIAMVRDGRDVAASFIKRTGDPDIGLNLWLKDNQVVIAESKSDDVIVQRYEDLITDPEGSLIRLCHFLGIPFSQNMLNYYTVERLWFGVEDNKETSGRNGPDHNQLRSWQINQPLFDGRGKWQGVLSDRYLQKFEIPEIQKLMQFFGYV